MGKCVLTTRVDTPTHLLGHLNFWSCLLKSTFLLYRKMPYQKDLPEGHWCNQMKSSYVMHPCDIALCHPSYLETYTHTTYCYTQNHMLVILHTTKIFMNKESFFRTVFIIFLNIFAYKPSHILAFKISFFEFLRIWSLNFQWLSKVMKWWWYYCRQWASAPGTTRLVFSSGIWGTLWFTQ